MVTTRTQKGKKVAYVFTEAGPTTPAVLGGKGAGLVEMATSGMPVPPGFTVTTAVARAFAQHGVLRKRVQWQNQWGLSAVEKATGKRFGDAHNPLLLSVRSGAAVSMPGMMDSILNLGINPEIVEGLGRLYGRRFALDCYRRFLSMFGDVVLGVPQEEFERSLSSVKQSRSVSRDSELDERALATVVVSYRRLIDKFTGAPMVDDPKVQLSMAMEAVLRSWNTDRAREYRRVNRISNDLGTAINVQAMVFGNLNENSATGVAFSCNCVTGEAGLWGEFLVNAQGEDVVAGVRQASPIQQMSMWNPALYAELKGTLEMLAARRKEVVDVEFTVEAGKLYILQVRKAKLSAEAAVTLAVQSYWAKALDKTAALASVSRSEREQLQSPGFQPEALSAAVASRLVGVGLPASPGSAVGRVVCTSEEAVQAAARGEQVVLVRPDTSPDDLRGMLAAVAIVTSTGGATCHAAVVARVLGKPCVVGCRKNGQGVGDFAGQLVSVDGRSGVVVAGAVDMVQVTRKKEVNLFLRWHEEECHGKFPKPRLAFEMVDQSVPVLRLLNDFYLTDAMARAAVGSAIEREANLLRTKVHGEVAERLAMYLAVAIGGEIRHASRMGTAGISAVLDNLKAEFHICFGGARGEAQRASIVQLKRMQHADHMRFAGDCEEVFKRGQWSSSFGGLLWGNIAEALKDFLSGKLAHSVFADHAFDLQHNGGSVFGKHAMVLVGSRYELRMMLDGKRDATNVTELSTLMGTYSQDVSEPVSAIWLRGKTLRVWQRS